MGFFNRSSNLSNPAQWLVDWFRGGQESDSGVAVTTHSALSYPPVWYAVSKIAGHVGQLPISVHRRLDRGSRVESKHPVYSVLKTRPNEYQTAIVFKEQLMVHALLNGDGRAAIIRKGGMVKELIPMLPSCTWTVIVDGKKWHVINCNLSPDDDQLANTDKLRTAIRWDTQEHGKIYKIPNEDDFHIPGLGYDGITGKSLIECAKDAIGLGLAAQKASNRSFKHGSRPSIILQAPQGALREEKDAKEFLDNWNTYHSGLDNEGKAALLREGVTAETISMTAADAQWIEQRRFQRQETALLFLLESILGDDSSVSYNSLEQKNLAYLSNCLMRWLVKIEQEADYKLLGNHPKLYTKFNVGALLRADYKTTIESLSMGITSRIFNPNEARDKLDMNPYDGGDEYANPAITPGAADQDENDANNAAVETMMRHMITTESQRVLFAAGNKGDYLYWLNKFYDGWTNTLSAAIEKLGGESDLAKEHCQRSYAELAEIAGTVPNEGLAGAVEVVVNQWPDRAQQLAEHITKGPLCVSHTN